MTRVLIFSDIRLYREGLSRLLSESGGVEVVGTAGDIDRAARLAGEMEADVVLVDMGMTDSLGAVKRIVDTCSTANVVALGVSETKGAVVACAEAGIAGYLCRDSTVEDLASTLRAATRGELLCSKRISAALLSHIAKLARRREPGNEVVLTPRQAEVAELLDQGLTNQEIATRLNIEVTTVKVHVHNILDKTGATNRRKAVARIRRLGILRPSRAAYS